MADHHEVPFQNILGRLPSGLFILTARQGEKSTGMLVSWVMQAGFQPPMVTLAIKKDRYLSHWLTDGAPFNINILPEGQKKLMSHFARGFGPEEPAFEGLDIRQCSRGVPILTDTVGHLQCEPLDQMDSPDHRIFLAIVVGGELTADIPPATHIRKNGLNY